MSVGRGPGRPLPKKMAGMLKLSSPPARSVTRSPGTGSSATAPSKAASCLSHSAPMRPSLQLPCRKKSAAR